MSARLSLQTLSPILLIAFALLIASPADAFGAGYVSRGSHLKATNFRHGDIALAVPLLATANRRLVKQIYFGNWLRDFSQLIDRSSLSLVPRPILRALVAVFAFVQFGYATREFEVTDERLGFYRPEEHVDNPRGYDNGSHSGDPRAQASAGEGGSGYQISEGLRPAVRSAELAIDPRTGMKNYIANASEVGAINPTSAEYVEKQLIAAIACGRQGDQEAYIHLGAALHTLEDFVAHSNYVELAMLMIGEDMKEQANITPALGKVFTYVGGAAKVETARAPAPPLTTGTFGALDLYQTLLGELDDKTSAMSIPGLKIRASDQSSMMQNLAKSLISLLGGLTPNFDKDILKIQAAAADPRPVTWGELESKPETLWTSLEPVFKLRDDIVKWVYDHLTIRAVQDALAAISTALDKLVYKVLGIFLGPLLSEFSRLLKDAEQSLLQCDSEARLASGEQSIFNAESTSTDPTHSQLAKDHYNNPLNELAGRVAVRISAYTVTQIVQLWQPGNTDDPTPVLAGIIEAFHHPFNLRPGSGVPNLMFAEIESYTTNAFMTNTSTFESTLTSLAAAAVASRVNEHASLPHGHSHVDALTAAHAPNSIAPQTAHDLTTTQRPEVQRGLLERISSNIESQLRRGAIQKVSLSDLPGIKKILFAPPTGETPNPLDAGLAKIPGISFVGTFEGVGIEEIAAADGMGETLKDAVVSLILLDETRGTKEEEAAAGGLGWGTTEEEKTKKEERAKLRELRGLLRIERLKTEQEGGQFDDEEGEKSKGGKMREGMERLKIRLGGKGV